MGGKAADVSEGFGGRLRWARRSGDLTLAALAARTGYTKNYLGAVERGAKRASRGSVALVADALGVSREWLAHGTGAPDTAPPIAAPGVGPAAPPFSAPALAGLARLFGDPLAAFAEAAHAIARARVLDTAMTAFEDGPLAVADPASAASPPLPQDALEAVWGAARDIRRICAEYAALRAQVSAVLSRALAPEDVDLRALGDELRALRSALARLAGTQDVMTLTALEPAGRAFEALDRVAGVLV